MQNSLKKYIKNEPTSSNAILGLISNKSSLEEITDLVASFLPLSLNKKLFYMQELNPLKRGKTLLNDINCELQVIKIEKEINDSIEKSLDNSQKEFILREKIKEIQKELGEEDEKESEIKEWTEKLEKLNLDKKIEIKIKREINKYQKMNELSPETTSVRSYLNTFFSLPWRNFSYDETDINTIAKNLNKTHFGLDEVKERIIEYTAVKKRNPNLRSPIICLVGPPGVGKTTIAMSIAESLNKEFYKINVGGLNDASELNGHRRTYLGASPGKIITSLIKCGTNNPVLLIDEVDKMTKDYKGDPSSVLLDALDYPQNQTFIDNYLEEPFDLSNIFFILTANDINNIPNELKDRLEIIELSSYTLYEKITLAREYLLPQIYYDYSLTSEEVTIPDGVISSIITHYTLESGVRDLKRKLETLIRKIITSNIKSKRKFKMVLEEKDLRKYLDVFQYNEDNLPKNMEAGLAIGLAWSSMGGRIIPIETCFFRGSGNTIMTGSLKSVIQESVYVALDYIKSHADYLKIDENILKENNLHVHLLDGSTTKDGPSAGIAITSSIISLLLNKELPNDIALTGEITLRGDILPVGKIKEKLIGAFNAGIKTVIIPKDNKKDLQKVPDYIKDNINIISVSNYKEVYKKIFK